MGVQGLWELLAPVGRRVSVEALSGRKLAIDASIWIIQFMKAMRDDKGDMIRNAHLLGFFRRICKLLYLRAKPVFVFDGGTPALKKRTVIARRRQRERAQSKIRKTAEKLLLNHLRTRKLEEIAQNIGFAKLNKRQGKLSHVKSTEEEKNGCFQDDNKSTNMEEHSYGLEKLPKNDDSDRRTGSLVSKVQEKTEESNTSDGGSVDASDESQDENEYVMPPTQGHVDPAVLASLPPSMQLNLLVQMREQLVADNRKKFQKVAKNPASFSQMQIQAYLKTVAFRRDINEIQKAAAGKGIGGIPSARIASEVDREYIFSTDFQPIQQGKEETHNGDQDNLASSGSNLPQEIPQVMQDANQPTVPLGNIDLHGSSLASTPNNNGEGRKPSARVDMQEPSVDNVLTRDSTNEDNEVEWEDDNDVVDHMPKETITGAIITIEIDQSDLLPDLTGVQRNSPHMESEAEDIQWENGDAVAACDTYTQVVVSPLGEVAESTTDLEDGNCTKETNLGTAEMLDKTLLEIESAELEEAIRQSLEEHKACRAAKLVIRKDICMESGEIELPLHEVVVREMPVSEEAVLAHERERKGKAIVDDYAEASTGTREGEKTYQGQVTHRDSLHASMITSVTFKQTKASPLAEHQSVYLGDACDTQQARHVVQSAREIGIEGLGFARQSTTTSLPDRKAAGGVESLSNTKAVVGAESCSRTEEKVQAEEEGSPVDAVKGPTGPAGLDKVSSLVVIPSVSLDLLEENINEDASLKEAEEIDLKEEIKAFAARERDLMREREELSRQQVELQAEMEAEQAAIQASLEEERDVLLQEEKELRATQRKHERNADSVTGEMFSECQELLQMFGLPYIIAPMEAEAQCAYMDAVGLVDGVVTDDCDVFLFGGRNVFKNIFDDRKYVETYYMKDVESELGVDQEKLIHMALLLGSDYTEGISGIGIVNAIEVVNSFEGEAGLQKFKDWLDAPDYTLLNKFNKDGQKKQMRKTNNERERDAAESILTNGAANELGEGPREGSESMDYTSRQDEFMEKHRAVSKNWTVPESFPNPMVINAYRSAQVDKSTEPFTWGRPDLEALRRACLERFGWDKNKSDELLQPVLKEYDRHETQTRLEAFYTFNQRFAKIRSKRIQKAVTHGAGHISSELVDLPKPEQDSECRPLDRTEKSLSNKCEARKRGVSQAHTKRKTERGDPSVEETPAARGRGRGRGRRAPLSRRMAKSARNSDSPRRSHLRDEGSNDELLLDLHGGGKRSMEPPRSSCLPERAVYMFSDSQEDDDTGELKLGGSPAYEGLGISAIPSATLDPSDKGGHDADTADESQLQDEKNGDYLVMGGGFCTADDENNQPLTGDLVDPEIKQTSKRVNNIIIMPLEESLSGDCSVAAASGSSGLENLCCMRLRRKKYRIS